VPRIPTAFGICRGEGNQRISSGKKENKLGLRASDTAELIFEDCVIPGGEPIGAEGQGFVDAMRVLDGGAFRLRLYRWAWRRRV